ncbi:MAG: alpha/beta hydrolase domain-containing protein [Burkholderiaceae bacterium]
MARTHIPVISTALAALAVISVPTAEARVTAFTIDSTQSAYEGRSFGATGAYEEVRGRARFAIKADDPANAPIVDLDKAPRNARGEIEFSTEVLILRPVDAGKAAGKIFYEVPNRGRNLSIALFNDGPVNPDVSKAGNAGNGFLFDQGYTIVLSGWQPDLPGKLLDIDVPVAAGTTGPSREEFVFDDDKRVSKATLSYPAADLDPAKATLTVRVREQDERNAVEGMSWKYLDESSIEITRPDNLPAGAIYEFIYPARDSRLTGLGFAATRDLLSFLRGSSGHDTASPIGPVKQVLGVGISQSGRFARDFVYQGFNADEQGHRVFDGLIAHIAGSRKTFTNYRFAQPGRYSRQHEDHSYPGDQFPFAYATTTDPLTGRTDGILERCQATSSCPRIMHTDTDTEFWQARAALVGTDVQGQPIATPENVRLYYLAGAQHFTVAGAPIKADKQCVFDNNYFHVGAVMRGLLAGLDAWVAGDAMPPVSRFPNRVGTTLVEPEHWDPVAIPRLAYRATTNRLAVMDHSTMPPTAGKFYPAWVPASDISGNAVDGIKMPRTAVPLGTHMGWNLRKKGFAEGDLCSLSGSYIPFARQAANRPADDGRPAIDQLFKGRADYVGRIEAAINALHGERLILARDIPMLRERAAAHWDRTVR